MISQKIVFRFASLTPPPPGNLLISDNFVVFPAHFTQTLTHDLRPCYVAMAAVVEVCVLQLSAELGFPVRPKASLTFSKCLEMKLQDHITVIAKVAEVAGKEYSIEQVGTL